MTLATSPKQGLTQLFCPKCQKFANSFVVRLNDIQFMRSLLPSDYMNNSLVEKRCPSCKTPLEDLSNYLSKSYDIRCFQLDILAWISEIENAFNLSRRLQLARRYESIAKAIKSLNSDWQIQSLIACLTVLKEDLEWEVAHK